MPIPDALLNDRNFWKRCAQHVKNRAGVFPGEHILDPVPGPGLLAMELAQSMPRYDFLVVGDVPEGAPKNLSSIGRTLIRGTLPEIGLGMVTSALTLDDWRWDELRRLFAALEKEIVHTGRLVVVTRLPTGKTKDAPTGVRDAFEDGIFEEVGFENVELEELEYLPDGSQLGIVHGRRPPREEE